MAYPEFVGGTVKSYKAIGKEGYTPDKEFISAKEFKKLSDFPVDPMTHTEYTENVYITYKKNELPVLTPNNPEPIPAPETIPNEDAPIPHPSDVPAEPETNHYVETVKPHATSVSKVSTSSKTNTRVISAKTENNDVETLPKTGEGQNQAGIIGLLLANLASLFGLAAGKKKN